ncbi:hypothetical protein P154DRAFT_539596 [Amniculicola lignicola CBS 123094]|uniref:Sister chromatid cohesion protein-like protein Dcc1 n=1 Tax=Amniculicola lignicola CBS 123094 TaxID=1392246 RepID=A0A6A5VXI5_9PLEO|nr:hypothetical protein P154DRAFT_539596 [Amniculicola lignicola CBS 123094]
MATQQSDGGVRFSVAHDLQQYRLLELPAELLELIDAANPPLLSIKSAAPGAPSAKPAYAVLCTPNKTYQLRQVQTSNSLFVAQPVLEAHGNEEIPAPTTRAVASCTATLELHPADTPPDAFLEEVLPVYDIVDKEVDATGNGKSKAVVLADIPLSEGQCEQAWKELMAFEFAGSSYRPSANTLVQVWKSIHDAALAEGIKLDQQFLTDTLLSALDDEGYPPSLIVAVLTGLATAEQDPAGSWSCLDRSRAVHFVGTTLLEAKRGGADYLTAEFLDTWREHVPDAWQRDAELAAIEGLYELPTSTTVAIRGGIASTTKTAAATAKPGSSSSRKWHEKFGRARQR